MLISNVEVAGARTCVRISAGRIEAIAPDLSARPDEATIQGGGGLLLAGLRDHHIHLFGYAAALGSVDCGPPLSAPQLAERLRSAADRAEGGWVRGVGYHPAVAGDIDRAFLDACVAEVPVRVQHRSGRLWVFNSAGLDRLMRGGAGVDPMEREDGRLTGRLYDGDDWMRSRIGSQRPHLGRAGAALARSGVTSATDTGHSNGLAAYQALAEAHRSGELPQDLLIFGNHELDAVNSEAGVTPGAVKFHLHDDALPDPDAFRAAIARAHDAGRSVAVHCVTVGDLVLTLGCLAEAGLDPRDRIEHASVIPPDLIDWIAELGPTVVTQPHFIAERGDSYLAEVEPSERPWLYRAGALLAAGVRVAGGSDAPYGGANPWRSMQAAVDRRTASGVVIGEAERLSPEAALALYTGALETPGAGPAHLAPGEAADLCLIDRGWASARLGLGEVEVRLTLKAGRPIWTSPSLAAG